MENNRRDRKGQGPKSPHNKPNRSSNKPTNSTSNFRSKGASDSGFRSERPHSNSDSPRFPQSNRNESTYGNRTSRSQGTDDKPRPQSDSRREEFRPEKPKSSFDSPRQPKNNRNESTYGNRTSRSQGTDDKPRPQSDSRREEFRPEKPKPSFDSPRHSKNNRGESSYENRNARGKGDYERPKGRQDSDFPKKDGYKSDFNRNDERNTDRPSYQENRGPAAKPKVGGVGGFKSAVPGQSYKPKTGDYPAGKRPYPGKYAGAKTEYSGRNKSKDDGDGMRLNRFIAHAGICSRREADDFIKAGLVSVNKKVVTEMGYKVQPNDEIRYNGTLLKSEKRVYILLNKPKGFISTTDDPKARKTVMDLVKGACRERIFPVGRLDRITTGVLLFTNDGAIADKLLHPSRGAKKVYEAVLDKPLAKTDMIKIAEGVVLEDGPAPVDAIAYVESKDRRHIGLELHIGRNRVVRRIFESLGYEVTKLDRVSFAGLTKKNLARGQWRFLNEQEVNYLRMR